MAFAPAPVSVPFTDALSISDVSVIVTFHPGDPIDSTEVTTAPDFLAEMDDTGLLNLLDSAIARLTAYRAGYQAALDEDDKPLLLPVPWHGWGALLRR